MKDFLIGNWQTLVIILLAVGFAVYLVLNKKWAELRTYIYRLIRLAEKTITGTKAGKTRFDYVFNKLYMLCIPKWLQIFFPKALARKIIQNCFDNVKDYLDDGKINGSIIDESRGTEEQVDEEKPPDKTT